VFFIVDLLGNGIAIKGVAIPDIPIRFVGDVDSFGGNFGDTEDECRL
jgi:hypothetical protein